MPPRVKTLGMILRCAALLIVAIAARHYVHLGPKESTSDTLTICAKPRAAPAMVNLFRVTNWKVKWAISFEHWNHRNSFLTWRS